MKLDYYKISGFRGPEEILMPANGEMIEFIKDVDHGDWKTASIHKDRWPTIKKGTKVEVVGYMQNYFGVHIKVKYNNITYDIERNLIKNLN